jgi:hypothetical protein
MTRIRRFCMGIAALCTVAACGADDAPAALDAGVDASVDAGVDATIPPDCGAPTTPERLVVTADWLARSLTLFDEAKLEGGAETACAIADVIPLPDDVPGPIELELTPDGRTAVVAVGPGFFDTIVGVGLGARRIPAGGGLLLVDLETRTVRARIATPSVPMSIAITPDGMRALTADFGLEGARGTTMSVLDLAAGTLVESIEVGPLPEQVVLDETGTVGLVNLDGPGTVRTFDPADPAGTLSAPLFIGGDPGDTAFVPGTGRALIARSLTPSGYTVLDVSDPRNPRIAAERPLAGIAYGVTHVPGTSDVLVTIGARPSRLLRVSLADAEPRELAEWTLAGGDRSSIPLGVAVSPDASHAFVPLPGPNVLTVIDLATGDSRALAWLSAVGPTYAAAQP